MGREICWLVLWVCSIYYRKLYNSWLLWPSSLGRVRYNLILWNNNYCLAKRNKWHTSITVAPPTDLHNNTPDIMQCFLCTTMQYHWQYTVYTGSQNHDVSHKAGISNITILGLNYCTNSLYTSFCGLFQSNFNC